MAGIAAALTATVAAVVGAGRAVGVLAAVSAGAGLLCCAGLARASRCGASLPRVGRRWFNRAGRTGTRR